MPEEKTTCRECGVAIQLWTAERTGGLCMPCKTGSPRPPDPNQPFEITCTVEVEGGHLTFITSAQELLNSLEHIEPIGDESHPNALELAAQRALLHHAIHKHEPKRVFNDHWHRTQHALESLFEAGRATIQKNGQIYHRNDVQSERWQKHFGIGIRRDGYQFVDSSGNVILRIATRLQFSMPAVRVQFPPTEKTED